MDFEREEEAFRQGLHQSLDGEQFSPLDPAAIKAAAPASAPRRTQWLAAAAVVVGLMVSVTWVSTQFSGSSTSMVESNTTGIAADEPANAAQPSTASQTAESIPTSNPGRQTYPAGFASAFEKGMVGAAVGNEIYLAGGSLAYRVVDGDDWSELADPPFELSTAKPAVIGTTLYFTSVDGESAAVLDTKSQSWTQLPIPKGGSLVAGAGNLFSVGERLQQFDAPSGQWVRLPADPLAGSGKRVAGWAAGGAGVPARLIVWQEAGQQPTRMAAFDPVTRAWKEVPKAKDAVGDPIPLDSQLYFSKTRFDLGSWDWVPVVGKLPATLSGAVPYSDHLLYLDGREVDPVAGTSFELQIPVKTGSATVVGAPTGFLVVGESLQNPGEWVARYYHYES